MWYNIHVVTETFCEGSMGTGHGVKHDSDKPKLRLVIQSMPKALMAVAQVSPYEAHVTWNAPSRLSLMIRAKTTADTEGNHPASKLNPEKAHPLRTEPGVPTPQTPRAGNGSSPAQCDTAQATQ